MFCLILLTYQKRNVVLVCSLVILLIVCCNGCNWTRLFLSATEYYSNADYKLRRVGVVVVVVVVVVFILKYG